MARVSYSVYFQTCCCRWTTPLVVLTVLCSNLCFVHTVPIVLSNTFNTAQTTVTTATVGNTASLKQGSSSATTRNKVASPSTPTLSSTTSTITNGISTLEPDHGQDRTSIAPINNIQQTNKTNKPYVPETGSTLGANAALRTGTQTSTRSTLVPSSASTSTPTSTYVAAKSATTATTTTKDSKAINVIHGAAALTSRKTFQVGTSKLGFVPIRVNFTSKRFSLQNREPRRLIASCFEREVGHYPISVEMGHVCLNGTDRRTVSGESFRAEKF